MEAALVHQVHPDLFSVAVGKEHVVRQYHRGPAAPFQRTVDVLEKVQLFVAGGEGQVLPGGPLPAFLGAKRRVGQDQVVVFEAFAQAGEGIPQHDFPVHVVEHGVHQSQPMGIMDQFAPGKGIPGLEIGRILVQVKEIIRMPAHIFMGRNHEPKGATGRIVAFFPGLGLHEPDHHIDEHPGREILAGPGFLLAGVLFQQSFIQVPQSFFPGGEPVQFVNGPDNLFQVLGLVDLGLGPFVDFTDPPLAVPAQVAEQLLVIVLQFQAAFGGQHIPPPGFRNMGFRPGFLGHFQEQDVGQFRYVFMIGDAVIPEHVTQVPQLLYDFLGIHARCPPFVSSYR